VHLKGENLGRKPGENVDISTPKYSKYICVYVYVYIDR
jgi:hypothetical protein